MEVKIKDNNLKKLNEVFRNIIEKKKEKIIPFEKENFKNVFNNSITQKEYKERFNELLKLDDKEIQIIKKEFDKKLNDFKKSLKANKLKPINKTFDDYINEYFKFTEVSADISFEKLKVKSILLEYKIKEMSKKDD